MINAYIQSLVINLNQGYQFDPKLIYLQTIYVEKNIVFSQEYILTLKDKKNALKYQKGHPWEMLR